MKRLAQEAPYAVGLLLGAMLLVWPGYLDRSAEVVQGNDFAMFWVGGRAILSGFDPYRVADWPALAAALGGRADTPVFGYPGWVAVALVPLAALPLEVASALWTFGGLAVAAIAVRALIRTWTPDLPLVHAIAGFTLLGSQAARTAVFLGQWSFLLVAALSIATVLLRRHPIAAGIASVALLAKPHLFVLTYPALFLHAREHTRVLRFAGAAVIVAAGLTLVSLLMLPGWPLAWIGMSSTHRVFDPPQTTTIPALLSGVFGPGLSTALLLLSGAAALAAAVLFRPGTAAGLGIWIALSLLVAPYQWSYDQLILLPAIVLVTSGISAVSRRRAVYTAVAAAAMLLVLGTVLAAQAARSGTETLSALVPALTLVTLVIGAWPVRQPIWRPERP